MFLGSAFCSWLWRPVNHHFGYHIRNRFGVCGHMFNLNSEHPILYIVYTRARLISSLLKSNRPYLQPGCGKRSRNAVYTYATIGKLQPVFCGCLPSPQKCPLSHIRVTFLLSASPISWSTHWCSAVETVQNATRTTFVVAGRDGNKTWYEAQPRTTEYSSLTEVNAAGYSRKGEIALH